VGPASDARDAYRKFGPALVRKAERILRSREDAVDVVHGLFVDLIGRGGGAVELPYLYRAVTNRCLNVVRDAWRS
jgi:DNA-directed RNA polymerase specialized sigma24 family protein